MSLQTLKISELEGRRLLKSRKMWEMVASPVFSLARFPSCGSQGRGRDCSPSPCGMTQSRGCVRCVMTWGPDGSHLAAPLLLAALPCLLLLDFKHSLLRVTLEL